MPAHRPRLALTVGCILTAAVIAPHAAQALAPGALDRTFQGTGWIHVPAGLDGAKSIFVDPSGGIVLAGTAAETNTTSNLTVWHFTYDGTPGFPPQTGLLTGTPANPIGGISTGHFVTRSFDGRIFVAGDHKFSSVVTIPRPMVAAFFPDGRPDQSFGDLTSIGSGFSRNSSPGTNRAVLVLPDSRILAVSVGLTNPVTPPQVSRRHPNGPLDASFGSGGAVTLPANPARPSPLGGGLALAVQIDGKILVARDDPTFAVTRLLPNGPADTGFGASGTSSIFSAASTTQAVCRSMHLLPDGKVLAAGEYTVTTTTDRGFLLARFLPDGTLDLSFGDGIVPGRILRSAGAGACTLAGLAVQSDGRIILTGSAGAVPDNTDILLMRFTAGGLPDSAFGTGGIARTDLGGSHDNPRAAALLGDALLLVAGSYIPPGGGAEEILLARFQVPPLGNLAVEYPSGSEISSLNFGPVTAGIAIATLTLRNDTGTTLTNLQTAIGSESVPGNYHSSQPALSTLAPGAVTTFNVSLAPTAAPGSRTASLTITVGNTNPAFPPVTVSLSGSRATPLEIWRTAWFGSPNNAGPGADTNDFDLDGIPNFMEYATRTSPHAYSAYSCQPAGAGSFTYTRPSAALAEFSYHPESAPSPGGPWSTAGLTSTVLTDDGVLQTVQISSTSAPPPARLFVRLRVTRP